jgi:hypothetical protein
LVLPGALLACAGDEQGTVVVVLAVPDDDFSFGFVVDVVVVVDAQGPPPVFPLSAWAPVPPVPGSDPLPLSEPWTIGRCAASAIAWSDCLLPHAVNMSAALAKATARIDARRPRPRRRPSGGGFVVPAKEPLCCIVLKSPPPAQAHPGREPTSLS